MPETDILEVGYKVLIQGKDLPLEVELIEINVLMDLDAPSMFDLKMITWDSVEQAWTWVDDQLFDLGNEVEIQMGYGSGMKTIMVGEITGLEPEFTSDGRSLLVVRGHDLRHRLQRGKNTQSFVKMKDSDIATKIAQKNGLSAKVTATKVIHDYVLQCNQSDWIFLQERAQRIGYEVFVDHKVLYFRPHQYAQGKKQSLTLGDTLYEFLPRSTTMNQIDTMGFKGWSPKDKKEAIAEAKVGKEGNTMGGKMAGVKAVKKAFGTSPYSVVDQPFYTKAEADEMATGQFQNMAIAYITGEGKCLGNADLKVSEVVEIMGIGKRFSGLYYLTSVEHHYDASTSYNSSFTVKRNAL